jgi:hypothetical protein
MKLERCISSAVERREFADPNRPHDPLTIASSPSGLRRLGRRVKGRLALASRPADMSCLVRRLRLRRCAPRLKPERHQQFILACCGSKCAVEV